MLKLREVPRLSTWMFGISKLDRLSGSPPSNVSVSVAVSPTATVSRSRVAVKVAAKARPRPTSATNRIAATIMRQAGRNKSAGRSPGSGAPDILHCLTKHIALLLLPWRLRRASIGAAIMRKTMERFLTDPSGRGFSAWRLAALAACVAAVSPGHASPASVLTYHNDNFRTGLNGSEAILSPANVNSNTFAKLFTYRVDGYVFAQPLYVPGLLIPGAGVHNVLYVATEHNS